MGLSTDFTIIDSEQTSLSGDLTLDIGYGTKYVMTPATTRNGGIFDVQKEAYGLYLCSEIVGQLDVSFLNFYRINYKSTFYPFYYEPLRFQLQYVRLEDSSYGTFVYFSLEWILILTDLTTEVTEETKTVFESILDRAFYGDQNSYIPNSDDFGYNSDNSNTYEDPYYKFNILEHYTDIEDQDWYGQNTYWSYTIQNDRNSEMLWS